MPTVRCHINQKWNWKKKKITHEFQSTTTAFSLMENESFGEPNRYIAWSSLTTAMNKRHKKVIVSRIRGKEYGLDGI